MDTGRLSQGQMIAGISGAVLALSLFLPWIGGSTSIPGIASISLTGWESQNTLDIYLFILALFAIVPAVLVLTGGAAEVPFANSSNGFLLAVIGTILTAYVVIDIPTGASRKFGLILALIAVIGVAYGEYTAMNEELSGDRY